MEEYVSLIDDKVKVLCILAKRIRHLGGITLGNVASHYELRRQMLSELNIIKDLLKSCDRETDTVVTNVKHHMDLLDKMKTDGSLT
jgi:hypothetical protein